jgi:guanylate kinase
MERILLERMPELELAVSATTRERRPNEVDGRHYWFLSDEEFDQRLAEKGFLEYVTFPWGQRSGTLRSEIDRIRGAGRIPLLDLETDGALYVKKQVPGAVTIFVTAPSFDELERRLRARATESSGEIGERLALAREQLELADEFDHLIVNDDLERAAGEAEAIVRAEIARRRWCPV